MIIINKCEINFTQRGAFVSEPAILVRRQGQGGQVWSMEKLENKIVDMRDMYEEFRHHQDSQSIDNSQLIESVSFVQIFCHKYIIDNL